MPNAIASDVRNPTSVCRRVISRGVAGVGKATMVLPALSVALATTTVKDRGVTPLGGVSVMTMLMVPVCGGFEFKLPGPPVAHPASAKSGVTASVRIHRSRGIGSPLTVTQMAGDGLRLGSRREQRVPSERPSTGEKERRHNNKVNTFNKIAS